MEYVFWGEKGLEEEGSVCASTYRALAKVLLGFLKRHFVVSWDSSSERRFVRRIEEEAVSAE